MKCPECNGEGGRIPHPENYGSYREDCVRCNGTGKQSPVDKIQRLEKFYAIGGSYKDEDVTKLETAHTELQVENERYLAAIKTFCDRSKWAVEAWKKQDYIAALFEIANL